MRIPLGWLCALVLPVLLAWYVQSYIESSESLVFLSLIVLAVVLWLFRLVPDFIPALLVVMLAIILDIVPRDIALSGYTSDVFFMVLGIFFLAAMMSVSGLTYRVALALLIKLPESRWTSALVLFFSGITLSTLIPSPLGRSAIATPLLTALIGDKPQRQQDTLLALSSIHGNTLLSTVFLTGNPLNFVMLGLFDAQTQYRFQWLTWLWAALPAATIMLLGYLVWLGRYLARHDIALSNRDVLHKHYRALGPISSKEIGALAAISVLAVGIITIHWHHIPMVWLALGVGVAIYFYGGLGVQDVSKHVDWGTLIFIASIVSWGPMINYLSLDQWLSAGIGVLSHYLSQGLVPGLTAMVMLLIPIRLLFPGAPTFVILLSALLPVTASLGLSPWVIGFALLTLSEAFLLPHQHGVYSQVVSALESRGRSLVQGDLLAANSWLLIVRIVALFASIPFWLWQAFI
ncbi:MAG: anion permease [Cellvibrionaceae bacterium]|nr:anion permease [Cellvibrionaceae bacterium]